MTLKDELKIIDETMAELESRRIDIINRMEVVKRKLGANRNSNLLPFPKPSVVVSRYNKTRHVW
jgi:hypothetical protein